MFISGTHGCCITNIGIKTVKLLKKVSEIVGCIYSCLHEVFSFQISSVLGVLKIIQIHDIESIGGFNLEEVVSLHAFLPAELIIIILYDFFLRIVGDLRNVKLVLKLDRYCKLCRYAN